jgi:opacity protein-like surface antigen
MTSPWRLLGLAAALNMSLGIGSAAAQRVMLRHLPVGTPVEVFVNSDKAGAGVVDDTGDATVSFTLPEKSGRAEMDANIFVDACDKTRRVVIVEAARPAPLVPEGCERREIPGLYWIRRVNTIVIDLAPANPTLLLVSGSYTPPKPRTPEEEATGEAPPREPLPKGLIMFAGGGLTSFDNVLLRACGNATPCSGDSSPLGYTFGATFWFTRYLGVEGSFRHPAKIKMNGGEGFTFETTQNTDIWNIVGKAGVQAARARIYGQGGISYHQATHLTVQSIAEASQRFERQTEGWNYVYGGGVEVWVKRKLAIFGEVDFTKLKGDATDDSEFTIDDKAQSVFVGIRVHIGG